MLGLALLANNYQRPAHFKDLDQEQGCHPTHHLQSSPVSKCEDKKQNRFPSLRSIFIMT